VLAAIGLAQLPRLQKMNGRRRLRADRYARLLAHVDGVVVPRGPSFNHVHARHLMSVLVDFGLYGLTRKDVVARMASRGVEVGVHYVAVHQHPYYVALYERLHMGVQLPVTEMVSERILSLPLYPDMHDFDVDVVVDAFIEVLRG